MKRFSVFISCVFTLSVQGMQQKEKISFQAFSTMQPENQHGLMSQAYDQEREMSPMAAFVDDCSEQSEGSKSQYAMSSYPTMPAGRSRFNINTPSLINKAIELNSDSDSDSDDEACNITAGRGQHNNTSTSYAHGPSKFTKKHYIGLGGSVMLIAGIAYASWKYIHKSDKASKIQG